MPCVSLSLLALPAFAQSASDASKEAPPKPTVQVGALVFPRYTLDLSEGSDGFNGFDIDRAYLRTDAKLSDRFAARLTLDANRMSAVTVTLPDGTELDVPADTRLRVFVKHAWLEVKPVDDVQVRFGMVDTPYLPVEEQITGMRWLFRAFLDDVKLASTTDLGVSAAGKHAGGRLGWGVGVYNGEFFSAPEVDSGKSFQARVTVDPLAGTDRLKLPITVYAEEELHADDDAETLAGGMVGFVHSHFVAEAQLDAHLTGGVTGVGVSAVVRPQLPDVGFAVARVDRYDPDGATADDAQVKLWAGLGRDFLEKVSLATLFEATLPEAEDATQTLAVVVHGQVGF